MRQPAAKIDNASVQWATGAAVRIGESTVKSALEFMRDDRRKDRLKKGECRTCFYIRNSRIGGAAMTSRPCGICGWDQMYGSTNTDVLCMKCAEIHKLCKYCGGDLEMRTRRIFKID
jgi:hypothetical protein